MPRDWLPKKTTLLLQPHNRPANRPQFQAWLELIVTFTMAWLSPLLKHDNEWSAGVLKRVGSDDDVTVYAGALISIIVRADADAAVKKLVALANGHITGQGAKQNVRRGREPLCCH